MCGRFDDSNLSLLFPTLLHFIFTKMHITETHYFLLHGKIYVML